MDLQRVLTDAPVSKVDIGHSSPKLRTEGTESLYRACQDFESVFVAYLFKSMRKTVPKSEFTGGGSRGDMYLSMMDDEIARAVAKGPGIGLAASIYRQLSQSKKT